MPITRQEFESGVESPSQEYANKILAFLASHLDEAFTLEEVQIGIGASLTFADEANRALSALNVLLERGLIAARIVGGIRYYAYALTSEGLRVAGLLEAIDALNRVSRKLAELC